MSRASYFMLFYRIAVVLLLCTMVRSEKGDVCHVTKRQPVVPKVEISFCRTFFPEKACCVGGFDTSMQRAYNSLIGDLSDCKSVQQEAKRALQRLFCMGCDPDQPKYTFYNNTAEVRVRICSEFAKKLNPKNFDTCGLTLIYARGNECSEDDVVHPSDEWGTGLDGVTAFINDDTGGKPPLFESKDVNVMLEIVHDQPCYSDHSSNTPRATHAWLHLINFLLTSLLAHAVLT